MFSLAFATKKAACATLLFGSAGGLFLLENLKGDGHIINEEKI